jgi:glycosyltransferase involved in cell wall biosynthesis
MAKGVLSVVIPVYNEKKTVKEIFNRVVAQDVVGEVIIIDDGSTDGTREIIKELELEYNTLALKPYRLKIIFQPRNMGKGSALRMGFKEVTSAVAIVQDADLEYDPNDYPRLVKPILEGSADVVYGSRFAGDARGFSLGQRIANRIFTLLSNIVTGQRLSDIETCYKVFRSEIVKSIPITSDGFGFDPEITLRVAKLGYRIWEVPISYNARSYKEGKKITWKDGLRHLWIIPKLWLTLHYSRKGF